MGFDEYDRKARLTPGLLAIAPIALLIVALGLKSYPAVAALSAIVVAAGGPFLLAVFVRGLGRKAEPVLWSGWGGPPTTALLRTRTSTANPVLRGRWRSAIERVTGITLVTPEQEISDPATADQTIEVAVRQVLRFGQDEKYPLVLKENIQYGFWRNLYGTRWLGRALATMCALVLVAAAIWPAETNTTRGSALAALAIEVAFLVAWWLLPSAARVQLAAERYANQLLQAVTDRAREMESDS